MVARRTATTQTECVDSVGNEHDFAMFALVIGLFVYFYCGHMMNKGGETNRERRSRSQ